MNYANAHFMTVIPEVDTPGHNNAIIMSFNTGPNPPNRLFPDINCSTNNPPVWNLTGAVGYSGLCQADSNTWSIVTDIITQLAALSNSPIYDMGGKTKLPASLTRHGPTSWINQEVPIVPHAQGKQPMGWADIASANFSPSDTLTGVAEFWENTLTDDTDASPRQKVCRSSWHLPTTYTST